MINSGSVNRRTADQADAYDGAKLNSCQKLIISMWPDGSGKAEINGHQLKDFVKFVDNTPHGRKRVIKMLHEAADLIENGTI